MSRIGVLVGCGALLVGGAGAAQVSNWCNAENGTAALPLNYSDAANWTEGVAPSGMGACAYFTNQVTGIRYVALPEDLTAARFIGWGGNNTSSTYLLGGERVTLVTRDLNADGGQGALSYSIYNAICTLLYADEISVPHGLDYCCCSSAGDIKIGGVFLRATGGNNFVRLDLYANAPGGGRTNAVSAVDNAWWEWVVSDGCLGLTAPRSADEITGSWNLTAGSPVITLAGSAHTIAVGTTVTGTGIPAGTFVKRSYNGKSLLLSQSATETVEAASVTFAAQTSHVYQYIPQWRRQGSNGLTTYFTRWGMDDTMRVEIGTFTGGVPKGTTLTSEKYPATLVIHDGYGFNQPLVLSVVNLEFAETSDATRQGLPRATVSVPASKAPEIAVTNGLTATIGTLTNVVGTLVKTGAGTLRARLVSATTSTGTLRVDAGTLALTATPDGKPAYVKKLVLGAGTRLELPPEGLKVESVTADSSAVIAGPGALIVAGTLSDVPTLQLVEGATLCVAGSSDVIQLAAPVAKVAGHPAFWVDATKTDTMTLDGDQLSRWNDCRAGETMFCTSLVKKATYVAGDKPYVKLPLVQNNMISNQVPLVWNIPLRNIRAVFLVQDPSDGGGVLLGRSDRLTTATADGGGGGFFYRTCYSGMYTALVHAKYSHPVAIAGEYYLNGESWPATQKGYRGPYIHVVEGHFKDNAVADAFGTCYASNPSGAGDAIETNGRMRICEYLIYTNALTRTERLQTAEYLSEKWRGCGIVYETVRADQTLAGVTGPGAGLEVPSGNLAVTSVDVGTDGTFTKTGEGTLFIGGMPHGGLHVQGGTAIVRSFTGTAADVPQGTDLWAHFDAATTNSFTFAPAGGTNFITRWTDVRGSAGNGITLKLASRGTAYPWVRTNAVNGLPAYDLGPLAKATGAWANPEPFRSPEFYAADGGRWTADNNNGSSAPELRSIFVFFGSEYGGNSILGARGNSHYTYGFTAALPNNLSWDTDSPSKMLSYKYHEGFFSSYYNYQTVISTRLNGESVANIANLPNFSGGWDLFSYVGEQPRQTQSLAISGYDNWVNGLLYGELVLYTRCLGQEEEALVTAYLMKKWKGVETAGYAKAELSEVTVDAGAKLMVTGPGVLKATSLAGGGTIEGSVVLASGAVLKAVVNAAGGLDGVTVSGNVDLSAGGTVEIVGDAKTLKAGYYPLVTSAAIDPATIGTWTCTTKSSGKDFHLRVSAGEMGVLVAPRGTLLILR